MNTHRVESVQIAAPSDKVFEYIADPAKLPEWTHAFKSVNKENALMNTPSGCVEVGLVVEASKANGTVDWHMTFPDGTVASAYSRVVRGPDGHAIYSFVLLPPPLALEQLEGTFDRQVVTLREELKKLSEILANNGRKA